MENLLIRLHYGSEDMLLEVSKYIPDLYELYVITLILVLLAGFIQMVALNKKYKLGLRFFLRVLDKVL